MLEFNPNQPPPSFLYATYIPGRHPQFKPHKNLGHAKNAVLHRIGIMYRWDEGEWKEVFRLEGEEFGDHCADCGKEHKRYVSYSRETGSVYAGEVYTDVCWDKQSEVLRQIRLCYGCRKARK